MTTDFPILDLNEIIKRLDSMDGWELNVEGTAIERKFFGFRNLKESLEVAQKILDNMDFEDEELNNIEFLIGPSYLLVKVKNSVKQGLTLLEFKIAEKIDSFMKKFEEENI